MTRALRLARLLARRGRGGFAEPGFGFDDELTEALSPLVELVYRRWWRVQALGLEHVPASGPGLIAANHAGVLPLDGMVIKQAVFAHAPARRHVRVLVLDWLLGLPLVAPFLRATGQTLASPQDALELLRHGELVGVFPEGVQGTGKPYDERYRLRRFGRGGFVRVALQTGAPIVPASVVGSEEIYPMLADLRPLARLLHLPYFPVTPTFPLLGPLGLVPLPSRWIVEFLEPIPTAPYGPEAAGDHALVRRLGEDVRERIQRSLERNLERRGTAFL